ncbi:MAG TPA: hypothetical protein VGO87_14355 [Acidimicrobiia bacterium]|jgi:hypothetical protein
MGKASTKKRVQRASGAKKMAMRGKRRPYGFYALIAVVLAVGGAGIALSRSGGANASGESPGLNDHWHTAYAVDICGTIQPNMAQPATLIGLHTHTDGLIHVEPYVTGSALDRGSNANLARFAEGEPGFKINSTEVQVPGGKLMKNGDQCDGKPGKLTIRQWPDATADAHTDYTDPSKVKITDGGALTIAFVADGADIPKPASIAALSNPNAGEGGGTTPPSS